MTLAELTAYAEETYGIREQFKWADFPGFSVLVDPGTGKWAALLMRRWDGETGTQIEQCDIRCGAGSLRDTRAPFLGPPFRMKGANWVGVRVDEHTDAGIVCRLLDRALGRTGLQGATIVLEQGQPSAQNSFRRDTALPPRETVWRDTALPPRSEASRQRENARDLRAGEEDRRQTFPSSRYRQRQEEAGEVPDAIRRMRKLFQYGSGSFRQKCKNFYLQGMSMKDYEDDAPWNGDFRQYFPTYHDLTLKQLRGYFSWRAQVRRGEYRPIASSLVYLYLYELLNEIGTGSAEESLRRMREFEAGYLDSGVGEAGIRKNLRRWMLELAVLRGVPAELARESADAELLAQDEALLVLRDPEGAADGQIFEAMCRLGTNRTAFSPVIKKHGERGVHLFAAVWRKLSEEEDAFASCFGRLRQYAWHPLANAVYWKRHRIPDTDYVLDGCRRYLCRGGVWREERYDPLYFDKKRFAGMLQEADRRFRLFLHTGHPLTERPEGAWAASAIEAVIAADLEEQREAARPHIEIDFSSLEKIREDAMVTRDSLLTEEEKQEWRGDVPERELQPPKAQEGLPESVQGQIGQPGAEEGAARLAGAGNIQPEEEASVRAEEEEIAPPADAGPLDAVQAQVLRQLLRGESPEAVLRENHLTAALAADEINECLFDEIGDVVLEWDDGGMTIVEDYREEVARLVGERE